MTKVLIIEDEAEIVSFLKPELKYEGYEVDWEADERSKTGGCMESFIVVRCNSQ